MSDFYIIDCWVLIFIFSTSESVSDHCKDALRRMRDAEGGVLDDLRTLYCAAAISPVCIFSEYVTNSIWSGGRIKLSSLVQVCIYICLE